jgi:hypothetical protein
MVGDFSFGNKFESIGLDIAEVQKLATRGFQ